MIVVLRGRILHGLRGLLFGHRPGPGDELVTEHVPGQLLRRAAVRWDDPAPLLPPRPLPSGHHRLNHTVHRSTFGAYRRNSRGAVAACLVTRTTASSASRTATRARRTWPSVCAWKVKLSCDGRVAYGFAHTGGLAPENAMPCKGWASVTSERPAARTRCSYLSSGPWCAVGRSSGTSCACPRDRRRQSPRWRCCLPTRPGTAFRARLPPRQCLSASEKGSSAAGPGLLPPAAFFVSRNRECIPIASSERPAAGHSAVVWRRSV